MRSSPTSRPGQGAAREPAAARLTPIVWLATAAVMFFVGRVHEILPSLTGSLPVGKLVVFASLAMVSMQGKMGAFVKPLRSHYGLFFQLYVAAILLSIPFSIYRGGSVQAARAILGGDIALVLIITGAVRLSADLEVLIRAMVVSVAMLGGAMAAGLGEEVVAAGTLRQGISEYYDPNDVALLAAVTIPFALHLIRDSSRMWRAVGIVGGLLSAMIVVKSGSRGGFLALVAVLLPTLFLVGSVLSVRLRVAVVVLLLASTMILPANFTNRISTLTSIENDYNTTAETGRLALAKRGVGYFLSHPLTGVGLGQFGTAEGAWAAERGLVGFRWSAPHNMYTQAAAELGIVGIVAMLGLLVTNIRSGGHASRLRSTGRIDDQQARRGFAIRTATIGFAVGATFLSAAYSPLFMFLAAIGIAYRVQVVPLLRHAQPSGGSQRACRRSTGLISQGFPAVDRLTPHVRGLPGRQ